MAIARKSHKRALEQGEEFTSQQKENPKKTMIWDNYAVYDPLLFDEKQELNVVVLHCDEWIEATGNRERSEGSDLDRYA